MLREIFLQQNAFHPVDAYSPFAQQYRILKAIMKWGDAAMEALKSGVPVPEILKLESKNVLAKVKYEEKFDESMNAVLTQMDKEFASLRGR